MKYAFFASGFRESRGKHTGTKSNAYLVRDEYQSSECTVRYVEYDDDPKKYAQDLASQWEDGDTVTLTGYSWGAGNWCRKFLWSLYRINPDIKVQHLHLIDPVVYVKFFWWLTITDMGWISIPRSVQNLSLQYQTENEPNASQIKVTNDTRVLLEQQLPYPHTKIDNADEVTEVVLNVAERFLGHKKAPAC